MQTEDYYKERIKEMLRDIHSLQTLKRIYDIVLRHYQK